MKRRNHTTHAAAFCGPTGRSGSFARYRPAQRARQNSPERWRAPPAADASGGFVLLSSRVSVEMVQKAAMIGAPFSPPSRPRARWRCARRGARMAVAACRAGDDLMLFEPGETRR